MPRTIPDEEYTFLQGRRQIADFVESIYQDPQLNKEAKALIKKKYPNLEIPGYDTETKVEEMLAKERKERDDREAEQRAATDKQRFDSARKETQDKYGFTNEAMEELEQFMVDNNVGSYEIAAGYKAAKSPKPSDVTFNDGRWNHSQAPGFKEIAADPEGWGRNELLKTLNVMQERERNQKF